MTVIVLQLGCGGKKAWRTPARLDLKPGDKVLRKSDRDHRLAIGVVLWVRGDRARIRWPAPTRIGGEFHHSTGKLTNRDLMLATDEAIAERRVDLRLAQVRHEIGYAIRFCRNDNPADSDWFKRNNTTPEAYFVKCCERIRAKVRSLVEAGRELARIRAAAAVRELNDLKQRIS